MKLELCLELKLFHGVKMPEILFILNQKEPRLMKVRNYLLMSMIALLLVIFVSEPVRACQDYWLDGYCPKSQAGESVSTPEKGKNLDISGYATTMLAFRQSQDDIPYVGRHDGFQLLSARLKFEGQHQFFDYYISLDGTAYPETNSRKLDLGAKYVQLKDCFGRINIAPFLRIRFGQFKAPFNVEELVDTENRLLITNSVLSEGVQIYQGLQGAQEANPINLKRQVGISVMGDLFSLLGYEIMVFNGNGYNRLVNDNDNLAVAGRLTLNLLKGGLVLGANSYYNEISVGTPEDMFHERYLAYGADLTFNQYNITLMAQFLGRKIEYPSSGDSQVDGWGAMALIGYMIEAIDTQLVYRFCQFDPLKDPGIYTLQYHTLGINYYFARIPVVLKTNYRIKLEKEDSRSINNDELSFLLQFSF